MTSTAAEQFHFHFAPEYWTAPGKFLRFLGPPFAVTRPLNIAISSCAEHIQKFETFAGLAEDIRQTLKLDREELDQNGYTPARRSKQFAAIVEVLVCELYSMLDGIRYTVYALYQRCRGVQQSSTSKLLSRAAENAYGSDFPERVRLLLAEAHRDWFFELRRLRTAFTHGGLGSCSISKDGERISYMNASLGNDSQAHVIEDIVSCLNRLSTAVFGLIQGFFEALFAQLEPVQSNQMCGIYKHRFYMRAVAPTPDLDRMSGTCVSRSWFEKEPEFRCPLADTCHAYLRAAA